MSEIKTKPEVDEAVETVEAEAVVSVKKPAKGVYLLPNSFTTASLFAGFYAIVAAMNGDFEYAAIATFVSMVLDGLDGRVARMTNTQSDFGAEYDSLADVVAFGVAPALVVFTWGLQSLGKFGWIASFIFVAGAALRLARFNVQLEVSDSRYFTGLPSPAAAGVLAGMIWASQEYGFSGIEYAVPAALLVAVTGILMVSNFSYYSFKDLRFKGRVPFFALLIVVLVYALVAMEPPAVLWGFFVIFALSGPVGWLFRWKKS
ncbi:MAG: CDP-diacylglycerol--serine O-phosphatidyltransferase [Gammaproteobacteria bacterium]|jgi:CDP-diacylglycerol--serine O-phosphatidyltransferase|nr:CDP-diacylglycerol--serine O-phosphatidyltransferase [Gammaproteobacteria bacterium]